MKGNALHFIRRVFIALFILTAVSARAAGPSVKIVTGPATPSLERLAAAELAAQLKMLFGAEVEVTSRTPAGGNVILIGSPQTNPAINTALGDKLPKLSEQGHFVRSVQRDGRTVLVVCGGSPVATLWAAYEVGYHFGVRSLLHADVLPMERPTFSLAGIDIVREPNVKIRAWRVLEASPAGPESWSLADHQTRLKQLAKLKFNRVVLSLHAWQPFVHFEYGGIRKQTGVLWQGREFRVDGETAGRSAFGRERVFGNPDFKGVTTYDARVKAGIKLVSGIIDAAHELGMTVVLQIAPFEFPKEFAALLPNNEPVAGSRSLAFVSLDLTPKQRALQQAQIAAYQKTYPKVDAWILKSLFPSVGVRTSVKSPGSDKPLDRCELVFLGSSNGSVLPQFDDSKLDEAMRRIRRRGLDGFIAASWLVDDLNSSAHYLSRAAFDSSMTPARSLDELVTPICGKGVVARVALGFRRAADAARSIQQNGPEIAKMEPDVIMRHYASTEPVPEWWGTTKTAFIEAMNEMYRANTRARGGARSLSLYHAKRFEFGLHYFTCLEETRQAGIARAQKKKDEQLEHLDKAVEAMHNALAALADVDLNNGDRGVIAALNEYGFRPLLRELEQ